MRLRARHVSRRFWGLTYSLWAERWGFRFHGRLGRFALSMSFVPYRWEEEQ